MDIKTSNRLSLIYGDQPRSKKKPAKEIIRGFIVYLEFLGSQRTGGIYARTFYMDFPDGNLAHHQDFERRVIEEGNNGTLGNTATGKPYPDVFDTQISTIHFGWEPCRVSYILNSAFAEFIAPDDKQPLIQPVVFREDKVVIDSTGQASTPTFKPNYSFYNLEVIPVDGSSVLRMDNLMLVNAQGDPLGSKPPNPHSRMMEYCLDIHIKFDQVRFTNYLNEIEAGSKKNDNCDDRKIVIEPSFLNSTIIVFDPPQNNGGGSGPP